MWPSKKGPDIISLSSPIVPFKSWFETPKHVSVPDFVHERGVWPNAPRLRGHRGRPAVPAWLDTVSHESVPTTRAGRRPNRTCAETALGSISRGPEETLTSVRGEENAAVTAPDRGSSVPSAPKRKSGESTHSLLYGPF